MIALLVGLTVICGLVVSWYGYNTLERIQRWGEQMNDLDAIFRSVATMEEMAAHSDGNAGKGNVRPVSVAAGQMQVGVPH